MDGIIFSRGASARRDEIHGSSGGPSGGATTGAVQFLSSRLTRDKRGR